MTGILLIDKPADWTSNDVVQKLRGILHERRVGHAGTLDPMATGLLTVFIGRATRAVEFAEQDAKRYRAKLRLGITTDTQDSTGRILSENEANVTPADLEQVLARFRGERPERRITIHSLKLLGQEGDDWILDIRCSKGTYIRTLCHDIGETLGCGGCMSALRRTEAGCFTVEEAHTLEETARAADDGCVEKLLLPTDLLFQNYPAWTVSAAAEKRIRNGNSIRISEKSSVLRLYSEKGEFLALGQNTDGECRTIKSFFEVLTT